MIQKILDWINKTGYPLELKGESILNDAGFMIINSHLYKDPEKQIFRELDLLASHYWSEKTLSLSFELLIECKKSDKPFLLLSNRKNKRTSISIGEYLEVLDPNARIAIGNPKIEVELPKPTSSGFKIIQAFVDSDEVIHKATNSLIKSFSDWKIQEKEYMETNIEENSHTLLFPILLLDAPLLALTLDEKKEMNLEEINSCILEYKSTIDGHEKDFPIPVITISALKQYLITLLELGSNTFDFLKKNPENNIKNYHSTQLAIKRL